MAQGIMDFVREFMATSRIKKVLLTDRYEDFPWLPIDESNDVLLAIRRALIDIIAPLGSDALFSYNSDVYAGEEITSLFAANIMCFVNEAGELISVSLKSLYLNLAGFLHDKQNADRGKLLLLFSELRNGFAIKVGEGSYHVIVSEVNQLILHNIFFMGDGNDPNLGAASFESFLGALPRLRLLYLSNMHNLSVTDQYASLVENDFGRRLLEGNILMNNSLLKVLILNDVDIIPLQLMAMHSTIKHPDTWYTTLTALSVAGNDLKDKGLYLLLNMLFFDTKGRRAKHLRRLQLRQIGLGGEIIEHLPVPGVRAGKDVISYLRDAVIMANLEALDVSRNGLGEYGAGVFRRFLTEQNTSLHTLDMSNCNLTSAEVRQLMCVDITSVEGLEVKKNIRPEIMWTLKVLDLGNSDSRNLRVGRYDNILHAAHLYCQGLGYDRDRFTLQGMLLFLQDNPDLGEAAYAEAANYIRLLNGYMIDRLGRNRHPNDDEKINKDNLIFTVDSYITDVTRLAGTSEIYTKQIVLPKRIHAALDNHYLQQAPHIYQRYNAFFNGISVHHSLLINTNPQYTVEFGDPFFTPNCPVVFNTGASENMNVTRRREDGAGNAMLTMERYNVLDVDGKIAASSVRALMLSSLTADQQSAILKDKAGMHCLQVYANDIGDSTSYTAVATAGQAAYLTRYTGNGKVMVDLEALKEKLKTQMPVMAADVAALIADELMSDEDEASAVNGIVATAPSLLALHNPLPVAPFKAGPDLDPFRDLTAAEQGFMGYRGYHPPALTLPSLVEERKTTAAELSKEHMDLIDLS